MTGTKLTSLTLDDLRTKSTQTKICQPEAAPIAPYVWDGQDEGERALTREEMQAGVEVYRRQRKGITKPLNRGE